MQHLSQGKIILAAALCLLPPFAALAQDTSQDGNTHVPAVKTITVQSASPLITRQFYGQIRARETVDLAFEVGGKLASLIPEEGMRIASGTRLARLELPDFERAVTRADLQLERASRDAQRAAQLAQRAAGAVAQAEDARTAEGLAKVALNDARAALDDATLTAPFDAMVAARLAPAHSIIEPGQPILRLHDMSEMRVDFDLPERAYVAAGGLDQMRFAARMQAAPDLPLRLVGFQPDASRIGQSYRVTLAFEGDPGLLPGASVTVLASVPNPVAGVSVPASAILAGNDGTAAVLALDGSDEIATLRRIPVTVATATGAMLTVTGLQDGTELVAIGAHRLKDGQNVRRFQGLQPAQNR